MSKDVDFCHLLEFFTNKHKHQLLETPLDALKTVSKKVVHITGEFLGNKIADVQCMTTKLSKQNLLKK